MRLLAFLLLLLGPLEAQQTPPTTRLQQIIERITRSVNARWSIYIKVLETGEEIAINADQQMDTMSTIKITLTEAVSKPASNLMLQNLRGQVYSSRLPKYVTGFRVPHKTGDFLPYIANH